MSEVFRAVLPFIGISLIVLFGAVTFHVVSDLLGPNGVDDIRKMRERLYRSSDSPSSIDGL